MTKCFPVKADQLTTQVYITKRNKKYELKARLQEKTKEVNKNTPDRKQKQEKH